MVLSNKGRKTLDFHQVAVGQAAHTFPPDASDLIVGLGTSRAAALVLGRKISGRIHERNEKLFSALL